MNCLIIDDEQLARELIKTYVDKIPHMECKGSFKSPLLAMDALANDSIDLLFLDIQMPDISGLDFIKTLDKPPMVILTTAYAEYALQGYELDVVDYLLKPIPFDRFFKAVNKAFKRMPKDDVHTEVENHQDNHEDFIMVKGDQKLYKILFEEMNYIEGLKEYVSFYIQDDRIISLWSLSKLENVLPKQNFMRVHKSYIVNLDKVKSIEGNILHLEGKEIPIGKTYREGVLKRFGL